jgi:hypothetical protein
MAWLQAVPKPPAGSKRAKFAGDQPQISRIDRLKKDKITPQMPPNPVPHIISRFVEIGMVQNSGMGPSPISWGELGEYQRQTGMTLPPWEVRLLRQLSVAYIGEKGRAEDETCPPPWRAEVTQREREVENEALKRLLG